MIFSLITFAQNDKSVQTEVSGAKIKFDVSNYDFGKIKEQDGKVTYNFKFKNVGTDNMVITRVQASCGCTTPEWTKEPIAVGKSGIISVTYNPAHRPGIFNKTITVYGNIEDGKYILKITGEVIPQPSVLQN